MLSAIALPLAQKDINLFEVTRAIGGASVFGKYIRRGEA